MNLFNQNINIPFSDIIRKYTYEQTKDLHGKELYIQNIIIPDNIKDDINNYLDDRKISPILNFLAFKRINSTYEYKRSHIDYSASGVVNCSIVIPVDGFENTGQIWYDGKYHLKIIKNINYIFADIIWEGHGNEIEKTIIESPTLVRTDIPHTAFSRPGEYRTTCTIRFIQNETFEYLSEKLS